MLNPRCNLLLGQLTDSEIEPLLRSLRLVTLVDGQQLYGPGDLIDQVYFPITALIAITKQMKDGASIDVALIGEEGAAGFRGMTSRCPNTVRVTASGLAYLISLRELQSIQDWQLDHQTKNSAYPTTHWLTRLHAQAMQQVFDSIAQETVCAHFHSSKERVARWLIARYEHGQPKFIEATHQKIADSLGFRRESVTNTLLKLDGIRCGRNHIEIHDFAHLERQSCECHRALIELNSAQLSLPFGIHLCT
jgi:CRP-like cAMP-binding protein